MEDVGEAGLGFLKPGTLTAKSDGPVRPISIERQERRKQVRDEDVEKKDEKDEQLRMNQRNDEDEDHTSVDNGGALGSREGGDALSQKVTTEADVDMEELEGEEGRAAKGMPAPARVSSQEREEHEISHIPFRDWRSACVKGRGLSGQQHSQKKTEADTPRRRRIDSLRAGVAR